MRTRQRVRGEERVRDRPQKRAWVVRRCWPSRCTLLLTWAEQKRLTRPDHRTERFLICVT
jgi:hypothetical protein